MMRPFGDFRGNQIDRRLVIETNEVPQCLMAGDMNEVQKVCIYVCQNDCLHLFFYRCISMLEAVMLNQIHSTDSIYFKIICTNKNIPQICQPVSPYQGSTGRSLRIRSYIYQHASAVPSFNYSDFFQGMHFNVNYKPVNVQLI